MLDDVLLDIEPVALSEDGLDALGRLSGQSDARWYYRRRREALAVAGLLAAGYNPMQPRGKDGKWIDTYGWVRWLVEGKWKRGQVTGWSKTNGDTLVRSDDGENLVFTKYEVAQRLFTAASPKATLKLPDPKNKTAAPGFLQVGPQAGSNPGAMYQITDPALVEGKMAFTPDMVRSALAFDGGKDMLLITKYPGVEGPSDNIVQAPNALILDNVTSQVFLKLNDTYWNLGTNEEVTSDAVFGAAHSDRRNQIKFGKIETLEENDVIKFNDILAAIDSAKSMGGSKPGKDDKLYIKTAKSEDHARNEQLANFLYELGGVPVPETSIGEDGITFSSKIVKGEEINELSQVLNDQNVLDQLKENFVFDVWLANWDVVGTGWDNVKVVDGVPYRIDAGGALTYRAQGAPKGQAFGTDVGELDTLITLNPYSGPVFKGINDAQAKHGAERLAAINGQDIINAVSAHGLDQSLADKLIARRKFILDKYNVPEPPIDIPDVQTQAPIPPPIDVTPPLPPSVELGDEVPKVYPSDITGMYYNAEAGTFVLGDFPSEGAVDNHTKWLATETSPMLIGEIISKYQSGNDVYVQHNGTLWQIEDAASPTPDTKQIDLKHVVTGEKTRLDLSMWDELSATYDSPGMTEAVDSYGVVYRDYRDHIVNKFTDPDAVLEDSYHPDSPLRMQSVGLSNWGDIEPGTWVYSGISGLPYKVHTVNAKPEGVSSIDAYDLDGNLIENLLVSWSMQKGVPGSFTNETFDAMQARNIVAQTQDVNAPTAPTTIAQSNLPTPTDTTMQKLSASTVDQELEDLLKKEEEIAKSLNTKVDVDPEPVDHFDPDTNINKNLNVVGEMYDGNTLDLGTAQTLVGKQIYVRVVGPKSADRGIFELQKVEKHPYGVGLVMTVVDSSGMVHEKRTHNYASNPLNLEFFEIEGNIAPILQYTQKKNGDIVVNGEVIGTAEKELYTYPSGYSYETGTWVGTISGKYTVSGQDFNVRTTNKKDIKPKVLPMLLPPGSGGSKPKPAKVKEIQKQIVLQQIAFGANIKEKTAEGNAVTMMDGAEVKLGMWTISKTDGKIGKIVATKVSPEAGVAGSVKVEYTDPVTGKPFVKIRGASTLSAAIDQDTGAVPPGSPIFSKVKLSDGSQPFASQEVMDGTGAAVIIMGIKPDGNVRVVDLKTGDKNWVKASSLTKSKDYAKEVIVEVDVEPAGIIALSHDSWKTAPKAKKIPYAAPGGSVVTQPSDAVAEYRKFAPGRKLTKDNFVPTIGMKVRDSKGNQLVIVRQNKTIDANPSTVYVVDPTIGGKPAARQPSALWVDHAAELATWDGKPVPKISKVSNDFGDITIPDGSTVYSYSEVTYSYGGTRTKSIKYLVIQPDGVTKLLDSHKSFTPAAAPSKLAEIAGKGTLGKIAYVDSTSSSMLTMESHGPNASKLWIHDSAPGALEDLKLQAGQQAHTTLPPIPDEIINHPGPPDATPTPAPTSPTSGLVTTPDDTAIKPESFHGDAGTLVDLPKPSSAPDSPNQAKTKPPPIPQSQAAKLKGPAVVAGSYTVETGIEQLKTRMNSGNPGDRVLYSMGDSDYIEDMAIRLQSVVDQKTGTEMVEIRFRLLEDKVDDLGERLIANGGQVKIGGWEKTPYKGPKDIVVGDAISVRIGAEGVLKPAEINNPNATVVSSPVLVGKTPNGFDAYSINVVTAGGAPGTIIVEQRATPSVPTYEWNPDKVIAASYFDAFINPDATSMGWTVRNDGGIGYETVSGVGEPDGEGRKVVNPDDNSFRSTGSHQGTMRLKYDAGEGAYMTVQTTNPASETRQANLFSGGSGTTGAKPSSSSAIRHSANGEVLIRVPIDDPNALDKVSAMMSAAGVPPSAQGQPSGRELRKMALNKVFKQFNTTYTHMQRPDVTGDDDASAQAVLSLLDAQVKGYMPGDRKVTMDDIHTRVVDDGRMEIVLSDDVARALTKKSNYKYAYHKLNNGYNKLIWTSKAHTGLMSTDERWSAGIVVSGGSSSTDVSHDAGNRLYFRFSASNTVNTPAEIILSPMAINKKLDNYWSPGDYWGRREPPNTAKQYLSETNFGGTNEVKIKRIIDPEMMAYVQVSDPAYRIKELHAAGITQINGRPVEEIFVHFGGSIKVSDIGELGAYYGTEAPITAIPLEGNVTAPVAPAIIAAAAAADAAIAAADRIIEGMKS